MKKLILYITFFAFASCDDSIWYPEDLLSTIDGDWKIESIRITNINAKKDSLVRFEKSFLHFEKCEKKVHEGAKLLEGSSVIGCGGYQIFDSNLKMPLGFAIYSAKNNAVGELMIHYDLPNAGIKASEMNTKEFAKQFNVFGMTPPNALIIRLDSKKLITQSYTYSNGQVIETVEMEATRMN